MAKSVYFFVAILVAGVALAVYFILNDNLDGKTVVQKEKPLKNYDNEVPQSKSESLKDERPVEPHNEAKPGQSDQAEQGDGQSKDKGYPADKPSQQPPPGHLKRLGEHGAPVVEDFVEELDYVLNGKDFYEHFVRKRTPVILRAAAKEWPAFHHWSNETYLKTKYGHEQLDVEFTKKYENAPPIKKTMSLKEFLEIYKREEVYLDSPIPHTAMTQDIIVPPCLQCTETLSKISSVHLLYSNGGTSSSFHQDGYENLLTIFSGKKEILLVHYNNSRYIYSDHGKRKDRTYAGLAALRPEAVDLLAFPHLLNMTFYKVTIHAGDILYIPQTWWHHVRSFNSPNIAISLWFGMFKEDATEEPDSAEELEEIDLDPLKNIENFGKLVEKAPETIECQSQNRPISEVFWPKDQQDGDLPKIMDQDAWTVMLNSGYKMPMKGFGTAALFQHSKAAIMAALKTGYRMIDTGQADGYDEMAVGSALKESGVPREDVFLVSKVQPRNMGYEDTLRSLDETLDKLQTSYVDLMLIHAMECEKEGGFLTCGEGEPRGTWKDCWKALEDLVKKGKVRSIGVSNFEVNDLKELMKIATIPPAVVQNFFTPFYHDKQTRKYCQENNIKYMGFSTLGNMYVREGFVSNPVLTDKGIKSIALSYDASPAQVVLKWALENDVIIIPQSKNQNHIETNFHLHQIFLSDKDKAYFEKLDGKFESEEENEEATAKPEEQEIKKPIRNKDIIDKLELNKKVNPDDATVYISSDDQYIYAFDAKTGLLMWKYGTAEDGGSRCAFSSDETVLYCGTDDNSIRAFDRLDGKLLWKFKTQGAVTSSIGVGSDGTLYVGCVDGHIYAINKDGSLKWKRHLGDQVWSSPALLDGGRVVFIGSMADTTSNVFALNGDSGEVIWDLKTGGPVFSSPSINLDETVMYICSFDSNCYAFDAKTGSIVWVFEGNGAFQSSPVISKSTGVIFVASTEGTVYAINSTDGKRVWKYQSKGEFFSSAFPAPDGLVYIGSGIGEILALNQSDGKLAWSFKTENTEMVYSTPKMTKDGVLYVGGVDGYLYALRSEDGQVVWKYKTNGPLVGTARIPQKHNMPQA